MSLVRGRFVSVRVPREAGSARGLRAAVQAAGLASTLLAHAGAAGAPSPPPRQAGPAIGCPLLEVSAPFERDLQGGASHCYRVALNEGQYLHLVVDQLGIDVAVSVVGPDGRVRLEVDGPTYDRGAEPVWFVADATGDHRLEVRSLYPIAPGRYRVRVRAFREATSQDRAAAAAQVLHARAERLRAEPKAESLQEALELYERALGLWREAGEPSGEARTLHMMGTAWSQRGDSLAEMECLRRVLDLAPGMDEPALEAAALQDLGNDYRRLGDAPKALDCFDRAAAIVRKIGGAHAESAILASRGQVYLILGELQQALDAFSRSLELVRVSGVRGVEAIALNNLAWVYQELGEWERASTLYDEALALFRSFPDSRNEAITLNNLGRIHRLKAEPSKALGFLERSLAQRRQIGDRYGEGVTLANLGAALADLGDSSRAVDHYRQALELQRATANRLGEGSTLTSIAALQAQAGEPGAALATFEQALSLRLTIGDRRGEADTRYGIARVLRDQGRLSESRDSVAAALEIIESLRVNVESRELRASYLASAQKYYELEIDVLMQLHEHEPGKGTDLQALRTSEAARARSLLDLLAEANADLGEEGDGALRERERSLRRHLVSLLNRQVRLLAGKHTDAEAAKLAREVMDLSAEHEAALAQRRASSPRYAALTQPRILTAPEIQGLLDGETLLVEYALGDERSYVWVVSKDEVWSWTLPARAAIEAAARELHGRLEEGPGATTDAAVAAGVSRLSGLILAPLAGRLGRKRLVFVGGGALQFVPLGLLEVRGVPLVADHEVVNLPSASALAALRQNVAERGAAPRTLAVIADPVFERTDPRVRRSVAGGRGSNEAPGGDGGPQHSRGWREAAAGGSLHLPRLVFSRLEARAILALMPQAERRAFLDFEASRPFAVGPELPRYRLLHFATHGILNDARPELSGVVLSLVDPQGRDQDGFLSTIDVFNLKIGADLVVLSACRSALGREVRGEGLVGLSRAFMYAGAPRIVASLWQVDDEATAELMKHFYENLLGPARLAPAAALRAAQLRMRRLRRWRQPHAWAGFVLQGEWR